VSLLIIATVCARTLCGTLSIENHRLSSEQKRKSGASATHPHERTYVALSVTARDRTINRCIRENVLTTIYHDTRIMVYKFHCIPLYWFPRQLGDRRQTTIAKHPVKPLKQVMVHALPLSKRQSTELFVDRFRQIGRLLAYPRTLPSTGRWCCWSGWWCCCNGRGGGDPEYGVQRRAFFCHEICSMC